MAEIPPELSDALSDHYELRGVVGRGGMATVYGARDLKHNRDVAIKVLKPELSANLGAERFLREIEIAAQLQHPHILMLIDSGQAGDTFYYVMPLVDGGSLRARIEGGRTNLDQAITITSKVADALAYAHGQGVVHRDIKPENILFSHGHPVVGDFGIAKALSTAGSTAITRTGFPLGTVGYMSPEQAAGSTDLGPATDVYSLACVTYEMLMGAVPGVWLSEAESDDGHMVDIPAEHRELFYDLPDHIEPALARGLARRPRDRFDNPEEFVAALSARKKVKKRFPEKKVDEIIRRAAEAQLANPTVDGSLTVGAIEEIAADVGLSPERVRIAIGQVERPPDLAALQTMRTGLFSLPSHLEVESKIPGELPQSEFGDLLDEIQRSLKDVGTVSETLGAFSWNNATWEGGGIHVNVRPRHGETTLRISEPAGSYKALVSLVSIVGGGVLTFGVAAGAVLTGVIDQAGARDLVIIASVTFPGSFLAGRVFLRELLRTRRQKLGALMRRLVGVSREAMERDSGAQN